MAQMLLKDLRINVSLADDNRRTPLWLAACWGCDDVIEWLIASGRDLGDVNQKGKWGGEHTAMEIARKNQKSGVESLLERFMANQAQTRHELRVKLGLQDELAAELFAVMVFLSDDWLQLKKPDPATSSSAAAAAIQLFAIARRLPMELQMILCHRAVGSSKQNILHKDSEAAFKSLAWVLLLDLSSSN